LWQIGDKRMQKRSTLILGIIGNKLKINLQSLKNCIKANVKAFIKAFA